MSTNLHWVAAALISPLSLTSCFYDTTPPLPADFGRCEPPITAAEGSLDNSSSNQKFVKGERQVPRDLGWGTDQEMCAGVVSYRVAAPSVSARSNGGNVQ